MTGVVCPGSFDPVHNGHLDVIARAAAQFDEVVVTVVVNPNKRGMFTVEVRMELLRAVTADLPEMEDSPLGSMEQWIEVHRRHDSQPSASAATSGPPLTEDVTAEAEAPEPVEPLNSTGRLPIFVLAGFGLLVAAITIGAVRHIRWLLRRG